MANSAVEVERGLLGQQTPAFAISNAHRWYVLTLFMVIPMIAWFDRNVFNLLLEPIRRELGFTDTQMGWITGPAVGIASAIAIVPAGWLADRANRRNLLVAATAVWSV